MKKRIQLALLVIALAVPFKSATADVNLTFNVGSVSVAPGGFFDVTVALQVTGSEQVNGVNYFLQELSAAGFFLISRTTTGSAFSDTYFSDASVASSDDVRMPAGADNALNPRNDYDLGAVTDMGEAATGFLATYRIGVGAGVAPGAMYTLQTTTSTGQGGIGWIGTDNSENPFNNHASMTVDVVPEPSTWALMGFVGLGGLVWRAARGRRA